MNRLAIIQRFILLRFVLLVCTLMPSSANASKDNILAHDLFMQGKYAKAAEIFTDPAWKGVALYRSNQWWRAAEAFVRADDADSQYNLGNCYVKLGYYELALDAYLRALSFNSEHVDAQHNADLMRQILAQKSNDDSGQQALQSHQDEIDQVEAESEDQSPNPGVGDEQTERGDNKSGSEEESTIADKDSTDARDDSAGGNTSDQTTEQQSGKPGADKVSGLANENESTERASTGAETEAAATDSEAAGLRAAIEQDQATEQWLNQINHDAHRFLQLRIRLEAERRQAAGQSAPSGGIAW